MKYRVNLKKTEESYSVSVPGLPGCWPQGRTSNEALENIKDAIEDCLAVINEHTSKPINAYTMGGIIGNAHLTVDEFKELL